MSKKPSIDEIFNEFEDNAEVEVINNERFVGFNIAWSMKGFGFGHLTYSYDKVDGCQRANTECISEKRIEKILKMAAPEMAKKITKIEKIMPPYSGLGENDES